MMCCVDRKATVGAAVAALVARGLRRYGVDSVTHLLPRTLRLPLAKVTRTQSVEELEVDQGLPEQETRPSSSGTCSQKLGRCSKTSTWGRLAHLLQRARAAKRARSRTAAARSLLESLWQPASVRWATSRWLMKVLRPDHPEVKKRQEERTCGRSGRCTRRSWTHSAVSRKPPRSARQEGGLGAGRGNREDRGQGRGESCAGQAARARAGARPEDHSPAPSNACVANMRGALDRLVAMAIGDEEGGAAKQVLATAKSESAAIGRAKNPRSWRRCSHGGNK